jgi:hypothetical protein
MKFKKGSQPCIYCENGIAQSREHVIPASFFDAEDKGERLIVPSCIQCNSAFAKDEEYVRLILTCELRGGAHPTAQKLWSEGPVYRSLARNKRLQKSLMGTMRPVQIQTQDGVILPELQHTFEVDQAALSRFIEKVDRGIFFREIKERLPCDWKVEQYQDIDHTLLGEGIDRALMAAPLRTIGDDILQYRFAAVREDPRLSVTVLRFYRGVQVALLTRPQDLGVEENLP